MSSEEFAKIAHFEVSDDGTAGVTCHGELDVATVSVLDQALRDLSAQHRGATIWVDMADVSFIDSSGLGVLVGALQRARHEGGGVEVRNLAGSPRKVFEITGLLEPFGIA